MARGYLSIVLHAHLPFVRHPEYESFLEETWLFEAITDTYIPLLRVFEGLAADGVPFRLTLSISPPLITMLRDPFLQDRYLAHLDKMEALGEKEILRNRSDPPLSRRGTHVPAAASGNARVVRRSPPARSRRRLSSAAGRGLPGDRDGRRDARLPADFEDAAGGGAGAAQGRRRLLSRRLRPRGAGLLAAGMRVLSRTGADRRRCRRPVLLRRYARHPECRRDACATATWRRSAVATAWPLSAAIPPPRGWFGAPTEGYPGDPWYRDFYRDIGFDLDFEYIRPFILDGHTRVFTGFKYYRITGPGDKKQVYEPAEAGERADAHAADFLRRQVDMVERSAPQMDRPPIITALYDAELFGHWWFEGPQWLDLTDPQAGLRPADGRTDHPQRLPRPARHAAANAALGIQLGRQGLQLVLAQSRQRLDLPPSARRRRAHAGAGARSPGGRGRLRRDARVEPGGALAAAGAGVRLGVHHEDRNRRGVRGGPDPRPPRPLPLPRPTRWRAARSTSNGWRRWRRWTTSFPTSTFASMRSGGAR